MTYTSPSIESRQPIAGPLVLGVVYSTPSWTDDETSDSK
jgi:hypothetical protein